MSNRAYRLERGPALAEDLARTAPPAVPTLGLGLPGGEHHGGMKPGGRDEPGTRLHAEQQFRDGAVQVLAATEAAGEGINLQVSNVLFWTSMP